MIAVRKTFVWCIAVATYVCKYCGAKFCSRASGI
jgi:hypothetical protein